jgi:hypothetical protein
MSNRSRRKNSIIIHSLCALIAISIQLLFLASFIQPLHWSLYPCLFLFAVGAVGDLQETSDSPTVARCTEKGWIFEKNGKQAGPFSTIDMRSTTIDGEICSQVGSEAKELLLAMERDYHRELKLSELNLILGITVVRDGVNKSITLLCMLNAQLEEDQFNLAFQGESSGGKSYIPLEIIQYFPKKDRREYGGASPTSFYHEIGQVMSITKAAEEHDLSGVFDDEELGSEKRKVTLIDLNHRVLIFIDQPHWQLLERLRPLLSHDKRIIRYSITDKTQRSGFRSKTVIIVGFCAVLFCTAKPTQEDQEHTRIMQLSPDVSQEKLRESLQLAAKKMGNRKAFRDWVESHPQRLWLKERIRQIRETGITEVVIPDSQNVLRRYEAKRPHLRPRDQRDLPRLFDLIKACALLNCFTRSRIDQNTIEACQSDIDEAFALYDQIAAPNELGISPETYGLFEEVILPLATGNGNSSDPIGVSRKSICQRYFARNHRGLSDEKLRRQHLPSLESAGLIVQEADPTDKRQVLVYPLVIPPISVQEQARGNRGANGGVQNKVSLDLTVQEDREEALNRLRRLGPQHFKVLDECAEYVSAFCEQKDLARKFVQEQFSLGKIQERLDGFLEVL